jgi:hypothetical protein
MKRVRNKNRRINFFINYTSIDVSSYSPHTLIRSTISLKHNSLNVSAPDTWRFKRIVWWKFKLPIVISTCRRKIGTRKHHQRLVMKQIPG